MPIIVKVEAIAFRKSISIAMNKVDVTTSNRTKELMYDRVSSYTVPLQCTVIDHCKIIRDENLFLNRDTLWQREFDFYVGNGIIAFNPNAETFSSKTSYGNAERISFDNTAARNVSIDDYAVILFWSSSILWRSICSKVQIPHCFDCELIRI